MTFHHDDLTIDDVLHDPLIRAVMRADRVKPRDLESLLRGKARDKAMRPGMPVASRAFMARPAVSPCGSCYA